MNQAKTIWRFFIEHQKFTFVLILGILIMGFLAIFTMPKEANPEVKIPIAVVVTPFIGASSEDVELLVTDPIEDQVLSLDGVDEVSSSSSKGLSSIVVQYNADEDMDEKLTELKDAVDSAAVDLPDEAEDSIVQKIQFSDEPILVFAVGGPYPLESLTEMAEDLADEMERVSGVSSVQVLGSKTREIQVLIDPLALEQYSISLAQVTQTISLANADIPIGFIETAGEEFTLRLDGQLESAEQIETLPITSSGGSTVFVRDVAEVKDTYEEVRSISRLSVGGGESSSAVTLRVFKAENADIIRTVDALNAAIEASNILPDDASILVVEDFAKYIREDLGNLLNNGIQTVIIVMLLLLVFLGWREALLAGLSIPMTFLITFAGLSYFGYTLNSLTLFALILSLGILVDTSIVITEAIHVRIVNGMKPSDAAIDTVVQYQFPLISGVLTTVFAFVPMLLTSGIIGEFIKSIPITVSIALMSSLFVGLGIVTTVSSILFKNVKEEHASRARVKEYLEESYVVLIETLLNKKWMTRLLALTLVMLFVGSLALPASGVLQVNMFPPTDEDTVYIDVEFPVGHPIEDTSDGLEAIEDYLMEDDLIESFTVNVGSSSNTGSDIAGNSTSDAHLANIIVTLTEEREISSTLLVDDYAADLKELTDGEVRVTQLGAGPGDAAPVEIRMTGDDLEKLTIAANQLKSVLRGIPGTVNVQSSIKQSNGELTLDINRLKANAFGLSTLDIALALNTAISGSTATVIRGAGEDIDVTVKMNWDRELDVENLEAMIIPTPAGDISLSQVVDISYGSSQTSVDHLDGDRIVRVNSYVQSGIVAATVTDAFLAEIETVDLPEGVVVELGGEREDIQQSYQDMGKAFIWAVILIAGLLILQFNSYLQPLFILVTIPLALIGVLPGLVFVGQPLSFPGIIGLVALSGIVVNNAIILIDQINKNRKKLDKFGAIVEACQSRFQPIILTTITTVAGILPLALSEGIWGPLGFAIIFGLLFSTVLTLVVVPVLYERFTRS